MSRIIAGIAVGIYKIIFSWSVYCLVTLAYEISSFKLSQLIHEFYQKFKNETTHSLLGPTRKVNSKIFLQFLSSSLRNAFKLSRSVAPAHRCYIAMFYWPSLYPKWIVCEGSVKAWSSLHNNHRLNMSASLLWIWSSEGWGVLLDYSTQFFPRTFIGNIFSVVQWEFLFQTFLASYAVVLEV